VDFIVNTVRQPKRRAAPSGRAQLSEPLQQVDGTFVLHRGRKLVYFAGCDYFRLASHPAVVRAVHDGLDRYGLNVAASRKTTGNHTLYGELEGEIAKFFGTEAAVLVSNGYMTNLAVAQALAGEFTHALMDGRSHGGLADAARLLECPVLQFPHRDFATAARMARRCGKHSRLVLLTDGLFSHSGEVAPLNDYLQRLPASTTLLVDDAHAAGVLGKTGRGTVEYLGVPVKRTIQTITLSKAFGVYGGAILGSTSLRNKIIARSRLFVGNTPLPLPLVTGALAALDTLRAEPKLRRRLVFNTNYVKAALREAGFPINGGPGPIIPIIPSNSRVAARLKASLLKAGIHPPLINYLGGPSDAYFRFVISSEHTAGQLDALVAALRNRA
jgi:7-keto-8-aminopelargonate synthetase-like enzyme